jgi:hypothetical protein
MMEIENNIPDSGFIERISGIFPTDQIKRKVLTHHHIAISVRPARDFPQCP